MIQVNYLVIVVATVLAFLFSAGYYILLNDRVMALRGVKPDKQGKYKKSISVEKLIIEFVRTFILGLVIAYAVAILNLLYFNQAVLLAVWLWIGFPVVLLVGSVIHENFSPRLAIVHAGDWLVKLIIFTSVLTLWG